MEDYPWNDPQTGVSLFWIVNYGGYTYTLQNNGHAIDRHALMNQEQCGIRARFSRSRATSFGRADRMNNAINQAWASVVNNNNGNFNGNNCAFQGACTPFMGCWGESGNCGQAVFVSVMLVFRWNNTTNKYDLTTAYPRTQYYPPNQGNPGPRRLQGITTDNGGQVKVRIYNPTYGEYLFVSNDRNGPDHIVQSHPHANEERNYFILLPVLSTELNHALFKIYNPSYGEYLFVSNDKMDNDHVVQSHPHANEDRNNFQIIITNTQANGPFKIYNPTYGEHLFVSNDKKDNDHVVQSHPYANEERNKFQFRF